MKNVNQLNRRNFIRSTALITTGTLGFTVAPGLANTLPIEDNRSNVIGPREGYTPQVGTLVSMLTWMRTVVLGSVKAMTKEQLDYMHDAKSNSIGSMLLHLAATERFYQIHTLDNKKWGDWDEKDKEKFTVAMNLGDEAREKIKGNNLDYYLSILEETRANSLATFKNKDDKWLMAVDEKWFWGPTNNYCKWFHVCEHESNHNGQIKWIKGRLEKTNNPQTN